jgi:hypothetical protein
MPTYTFYGCTIEVAKGGQSAKATRHVDAQGNALKPPQTAEFKVIAEDGAPTPQVQAQRWAAGKPARKSEPQIITAGKKLSVDELEKLTLTKPEAERVAKLTAPKKK